MRSLAVAVALLAMPAFVHVQARPRGRDLGVPFDGAPGAFNAITDVAGVEVGMATLISGDGALKVGSGPVRTGVTAILPRGRTSKDPAFAGWFAMNGNGEMTGTTWVEESGFLEGPIFEEAITNALVAGETMTGADGHRVEAIPRDRLQQVLRRYNRLNAPAK